MIEKKWVILLAIAVTQAVGLYVEADQNGFCFEIPSAPGSTYKIYYESMAMESALRTRIRNQERTENSTSSSQAI